MKGKITILAVLGFIVFFAIEAQAVNWVFYSKTDDSGNTHYYDPQSIKRVSEDIVQVWTKMVLTKKDAQELTEKYGAKFNEVSF